MVYNEYKALAKELVSENKGKVQWIRFNEEGMKYTNPLRSANRESEYVIIKYRRTIVGLANITTRVLTVSNDEEENIRRQMIKLQWVYFSNFDIRIV